MKPGHLVTAIKTQLGHINKVFYWFINLKMNVDYKTTLICGQPILDCMVPYLKRVFALHAVISLYSQNIILENM